MLAYMCQRYVECPELEFSLNHLNSSNICVFGPELPIPPVLHLFQQDVANVPHSNLDFVKQVHSTCDVVREDAVIPPLVSELVLAARTVCLVRNLLDAIEKDMNVSDRDNDCLSSVNSTKLGDCLSEVVYHIGYVPFVCLLMI